MPRPARARPGLPLFAVAVAVSLSLAPAATGTTGPAAAASEPAAARDAAWTDPAPPSLADLAITVTADHPREFIYTDKGAAHLAGEAVGPDTRSYHGFYIAMHEVLDGWTLRLEDGTEVGPATAIAADVRPDFLVRHHRLPSGEIVDETVQLLDRENGFRVVYDGIPSGRFELLPRVDMRFLWKVVKPAYEVRWEDGVLLVSRSDALAAPPDPARPAWLAIALAGAEEFLPDGRFQDATYPKDAARRAMATASPYLPGGIAGRIPPRIPWGTVEVVFAADTTAAAAAARARRLREEAPDLVRTREERMERLLAESLVETGDPRDDLALAWARISLDDLIMEQRGLGIYAGFYWFTTYWGRDTFITLPGACLVSGRFDLAERLLRDFARFQETDPASPREGRVPNFVTVDQVQYASVDGTWWFVRALDELWMRSGRDAVARELAPVVFRAVAGARRHAVDELGFLTHGDGETWMDAGGERNPYSPRGDRAVEVQALWHRGLLVAARLAERFPDAAVPEGCLDAGERGAALAGRCRELAGRLAGSFHRLFFADGRLADHLDPDGAPDGQVRPNGLLALMVSPTLFTAEERAAVTDVAGRELAMPWGVRSLAAGDSAYHPRHLDLARYYYDEAYHNGDVWLWLSGAYVSALADPRDGFGQTRMLLDEILDEGAVGTLQEIRDGDRAATNDEFGGATSQAWSLAELLRNVVDDYLGLAVDLTARPPRVRIAPRLPETWPSLEVATRIGERRARIACRPAGVDEIPTGAAGAGWMSVELQLDGPLPAGWEVELTPPGGTPGGGPADVARRSAEGIVWIFEEARR